MRRYQAFSQYGSVLDSIVLKDRETGRSRGFGFVSMENSDEAQAAIDGLNEQQLDGRTIRVNVANDRPASDRPQRGGFRGGSLIHMYDYWLLIDLDQVVVDTAAEEGTRETTTDVSSVHNPIVEATRRVRSGYGRELADAVGVVAPLANSGIRLTPLRSILLPVHLDAQPTPPVIVKKKLIGPVGFSNLPNQVHRKSIKKGFQFTFMVVGESGLGKSTLVNTLFNTTLYPGKEPKIELTTETPSTVEIQAISADIEENGVKLKLTVIDTPGFGDFINNEECWTPILENIEARFDAFLDQENRVNRKRIVDTRVHACLYFIAPTGHALKPLDVEFMKKLAGRVNLIPVIAKSDTMTDEELKNFKARILDDIDAHNIKIYQPPTYDNDDPETIQENKEIVSRIPFAVVGADRDIDVGAGRKVRGRKYPWGIIEVDNEDHCDFVKLRQMLIRTHMEELKEFTNEVLYESYRTAKLAESGGDVHTNPLKKIENDKKAHEAKMIKMENEMKSVFDAK
ncbi:hypothetical protein HDU82_001340, partial [Entophlyctis luteolus]